MDGVETDLRVLKSDDGIRVPSRMVTLGAGQDPQWIVVPKMKSVIDLLCEVNY